MSWTPLVAHNETLDLLRRALSRGRLGHSFLFVGPEGVGKRRAAQHFAQGLLCESNSRDSLDPCGRCAGCRQVENESHPDYFTVARPEESNDLPIEAIRELCEKLSLKPARGGYKVAIVDDADLLNEASANCFLKTLEEPPPNSILIMLASGVETQLLTIVSRCQVLRFRQLTTDEVEGLLQQLHPELDAVERARLAKWSGGSVSRAMELAGQQWQELRRFLLTGLSVRPLSTVKLADQLLEFIEAAGSLAAVKRSRARQVIGLVTDFYRQALFAQQTGELTNATVDQVDESDRALQQIAQSYPPDIIVDLIDRCLQADYHLARSLHQQLSLECWLDDLAQICAGEYVAPVG